MTEFLEQLEPGPSAIKAGIDSLLAGERARHGGRWYVVSPPDGFEDDIELSPVDPVERSDARPASPIRSERDPRRLGAVSDLGRDPATTHFGEKGD